MSGRDQKKRGAGAAPPPATKETGWARDAAIVCRADLRVSPDLARRVKQRTFALLGGPLVRRPN